MLHEKPVKYGPLGDDVDETNMAWTGEKRRGKYLPQSSSSDAPIVTAKDHQVPISDMAIVLQEHDYPVIPRAVIREEEEEEEEEETQELFGQLGILSEEDQVNDAKKLTPNVPRLDSMTPFMSWPEKMKVLAQHARYRIAYYKIVNPESELKLKEPHEYSDNELHKQQFCKLLEHGFEWFFHPDDIGNPDLDDYQRISLKAVMWGSIDLEYLDVKQYHDFYHTYEMDAVYVKYYEEISKEIKWIEKYLDLAERSEWSTMEIRGWRQALRIATSLPHMTHRLASFAYREYIAELREDAALKDLDLVYFEIWRLVVKEGKEYKHAVRLVSEMEKFNMHKPTMDAELLGVPVFWTMKQRIFGIIRKGDNGENAEDNKARDLFRKGVARLKTKNMVKYAQKKMEIAERLNLHQRNEVP